MAALEDLKTALCTAPVLAIMNPEKPFRLETDASGKALGAVLSQQDDQGRWHPVAYGSRTLNKAEINYHSTKSEFLALKWAATEHFAEYLVGNTVPFEVLTDNNPLTYIMTSKNLDATGHRWVNALAQCRFTLKYQKGKNNVVADALSRLDRDMGVQEVQCLLQAPAQQPKFPAEAANPALQDAAEKLTLQARAAAIAPVDWGHEQAQDTAPREVREWLRTDRRQNLKQRLVGAGVNEAEAGIWARERAHFRLKAGILYREYQPPRAPSTVLQFVTPRNARAQAMAGCHEQAGHQGKERTLSLLTERFWWPGMAKEAEERIQKCRRCLQHAARPVRAPLQPITAGAPLELVHVDYTSMEDTVDTKAQPRGVSVLVMTDHFTRFVRAVVAPNQKAETTAELLYREFFMVLGFPRRVVMDNALALKSRVMEQLCERLNIEKCHTTPFHPQTNGQVERMNQTLQRMIGKLPADKKGEWTKHLDEVVHAYNCTRSAVTGYSPYYLMFGRRPRLPVDYRFPTLKGQAHAETSEEWVSALEERLRAAFRAATQQSAAEAQRQQRYYDRRAKAVALKVRDLVLVRVGTVRGRRKLADKWEPDTYEVVEEMTAPLVYRVRKQSQDALHPGRVLHRNNLFLLQEAAPVAAPAPLPSTSTQARPAALQQDPSGFAEQESSWIDKLTTYAAKVLWPGWSREAENQGGTGCEPPEKQANDLEPGNKGSCSPPEEAPD